MFISCKGTENYTERYKQTVILSRRELLIFNLHALVGLKLQRKSPVCMLSTSGDLLFTTAFEIDTEDIENISVHPAAFVTEVFNNRPIYVPLDRGPTHKEESCIISILATVLTRWCNTNLEE